MDIKFIANNEHIEIVKNLQEKLTHVLIKIFSRPLSLV